MTDLHADAKVGDVVFYRGTTFSIQAKKKIVRITKTQLVVSDGDRFRLSDGKLVGWQGTSFSTQPMVLPITDEHAAREWARGRAGAARNVLDQKLNKASKLPSKEEFDEIQKALDNWRSMALDL